MNQESKQTCCSSKCKCGWIVGLIAILAIAGGAAAYYYFIAPKTPSLSDTTSLLNVSEIAAPQNTEFFYALQSSPGSKMYQVYKNALQNPEHNPLFIEVQSTLKDKYDIVVDPKLISALNPQGLAILAWPLEGKKSIFETVFNTKNKEPLTSLPLGLVLLMDLGPKAQVVEMIGKFLPASQNQEKVVQGSSQVDGNEIYFAGPKNEPTVKIYWSYWNNLLVTATREADLTQTLQRLKANKNEFAKNPQYQKAKELSAQPYEAFVFVDLLGLAKQAQDDTTLKDALVKQFVGSFQSAFLSTRSQNNNLVSDARLVWNKETAGPLGQALTTVDQKINYQYASVAPSTANFVQSVNITSLWNMAKKIMALYPSQAETPNKIEQQLKPMGLNLDKDILQNITGELSLLVTWPSGQQSTTPGASLTDIMQYFSGLTENSSLMLGLQNTQAFQPVLQKALGPILLQAQVETYQGYQITNGGAFAFSFLDKALLVGTKPNAIKKTIDAIKTKQVLQEKETLKNLSQLIDTKTAVAQFYMDYPAYLSFVTSMSSANAQGKTQPAANDTQAKLNTYLESIKQLYGDVLMSFSVQQDGLQMRVAMELK